MLHASGHDKKFSGLDLDLSSAELHDELSFDHQEELAFMLMMVPDEIPLELRQLHIVFIQLADDLGGKMVREEREFLGDVYRLHVPSLPCSTAAKEAGVVPARAL